jgi:dTDP-glucose 4,6-dehydratase
MRILITGGAGFVGHHIIEGILKNTDWDIVVLDGLNYAGDTNKITDISIYPQCRNRVWFVYHNLISEISEQKHKQIGNIHYCLHLAAESHVENSLHDAIPFAYNVVATTNLLQYLRDKQSNLQRYIGFNTDEVFGPAPNGVFYKETDKFYPSNPYSASKGGQWCMEYGVVVGTGGNVHLHGEDGFSSIRALTDLGRFHCQPARHRRGGNSPDNEFPPVHDS